MQEICTLCLGESGQCSACGGTGTLDLNEASEPRPVWWRVYVLQPIGGIARTATDVMASSKLDALTRAILGGLDLNGERVSVQRLYKSEAAR